MTGKPAYLFLLVVGLLSLTNADSPSVQTFDPDTLYNHFKSAASMQEAHMAGAGGITYLTPKSQHLVNNGTISRSTIEGDLNRLSNSQKKKMKSTEQKIGECWKQLKDETNGLLDMDLTCYLMKSMTSSIFNPASGLRDTVRQIVSHFAGAETCPAGYEQRVQAGISNVKFLNCLTQKNEDLEEVMVQLAPSGGAGWGLHAELGIGASIGYYYQESTGVAWNFQKGGEITTTKTTCHGGKLDLSAGVGISISFLPDMNDLLGDAMTIELGVDLIGELGFDVLLHYAYGDDGFPNKFVGFGFAFGIGVGIMPVDVALSYCNTELVFKLSGRSNGYAVINVAGMSDITGGSLSCTERLLGVSVGGKVCCPQEGLCPPSEYCWTSGAKCPRSPANIMTSTGLQLRGKYDREWVLKRSFCANVQKLQPRANTLAKCTKRFDRKAADRKQKYMIFKEDVNECWFSNTFSLHSCVWAPSRVSQITYKEVTPRPHRHDDNLGPDSSQWYRHKGPSSGRGGGRARNEMGDSGIHTIPIRPGHNPKG